MKALLIRNFKLRRYTLIIYVLLLTLYPFYIMLDSTKFFYLLQSFISPTILIIWILDAGHLFRLNRRLGGNDSYYFYMSLPVSKKQLLNANYITCIVLTLVGTLVISLYAYEADVIEPNSISQSQSALWYIRVYYYHFSSIFIFNCNSVGELFCSKSIIIPRSIFIYFKYWFSNYKHCYTYC